MKSVSSNNRTAIPEGKYECVCVSCQQKESQKGTPYIEFEFLIRNDVEQAAKGRHIFKKFFKDDNGQWPEAKIGKYANSLGVPVGEDFEYWQLRGMFCIVAVKNYTDDDTGEIRDCVYFTAPSKFQQKEAAPSDFSDVPASETPFAEEGSFDVKSEDIPF